ncbi:hypothetical protein CKAN_00134500 [Cinnamomum micranthum f. kanehirae]|uniref:Secreted protein n=1 Tax=Cinnamomum micranthum f. kanehirae TaxID=337451 RepID=A0A443N3L1_9MAGN|nr:hypothetical protein CKAN_00134500 [Cinnamomum micranthum f. kanehirae]
MARFSLLVSAFLLLGLFFVVEVCQNALRHAITDARQRPTRSHACYTATNAARSVSVCRPAHMGTRRSAHATTTGRQRKEDPSALE